MTDAQTEARAIAARLREDIREEANGYRRQSLKMAADALDTLAAKDAELADVKGQLQRQFDQTLRFQGYLVEAKAQLAEARKALEPFSRHLDEMKFDLDNNGNPLPDDQAVGWVYVTNGDFRAARRALTGGLEDACSTCSPRLCHPPPPFGSGAKQYAENA